MLFQLLFQQPAAAPPQSFTGVFDAFRVKAVAAAPALLTGAGVLLVFWIIASVGRRLIALAAPRVKADTGVVLLLSRLYYYGVLVFGFITALGTAGLNVGALIAGLGLTGFALGFALKDVLSNFVSGIMLLAYRPFHIGDVIEMGEFLGRIETIRIRDTLVRTNDGRLVIIPNTKLITEVVVNHTDAGGAARDEREALREADAETLERAEARRAAKKKKPTAAADDEDEMKRAFTPDRPAAEP
jgi:small conductance mechanosensitive channel